MDIESFHCRRAAAVRALDYNMEMGFEEIVVEGDALGILWKIQTMDTDLSPIATIVDEARMKIANFNTCNMAHTRCSGNAAAASHCLAEYGLKGSWRHILARGLS
ncbi:hypothetical protein CRYUN_Cryun13aG0038700 [Craigia yunnanensis]